jgi:hypothetical protein
MNYYMENRKGISKKFKSIHRKLYKKHMEDSKVEFSPVPEDFDCGLSAGDLNPDDYVLFADREDATKYSVYTKNTLEMTKIDYKYLLNNLEKEYRDEYLSQARLASFEYLPYNLEKLVKMRKDGVELTIVNLYKPPMWRFEEPSADEIPPKILKFICHLFPGEKVREYVFNWMYYMILDKNSTILVMNGAKGVGKNLFVNLCYALVGLNNFQSVGLDALLNNFNSSLAHKRLQFIDEFKIGKKEHKSLKAYTNSMQAIERKGVDVTDPEKTYNSWVVASNDVDDVYIEWDDRRFSPVEMTDIRLQKVMTDDEINEIDRYFLDYEETEEYHQDIIDFGHWILNNGKSNGLSKEINWTGRRFWEIVLTSLSVWKRSIINYILDADYDSSCPEDYEAEIKKIKKYHDNNNESKFHGGTDRIKEFLKEFKLGGEELIGDYVSEGSGRRAYIKVNPAFIEKAEEMGLKCIEQDIEL